MALSCPTHLTFSAKVITTFGTFSRQRELVASPSIGIPRAQADILTCRCARYSTVAPSSDFADERASAAVGLVDVCYAAVCRSSASTTVSQVGAGGNSWGPNVLSQRLRDLEDGGVLRRRMLPPPASARVYELTPWGADLEPVFRALARWGMRSPVPRQGRLSADSIMLGLRTFFDTEHASTSALRRPR
jgi:hypothetical protein